MCITAYEFEKVCEILEEFFTMIAYMFGHPHEDRDGPILDGHH